MPNFYSIDGIKINFYFNDHVPPHVHALYGEHEALIVIADGSLYEGYLPKVQLKKASAFVVTNAATLFALFYSFNPKLRK